MGDEETRSILERREMERIPFPVPVYVEWGESRHTAIAINLCELGIRFRATEGVEFPKGCEVMLNFALPGEVTPIHVLGWVAAHQEETGGTSVTFLYPKVDDVIRIRTYVRKQLSRPTPAGETSTVAIAPKKKRAAKRPTVKKAPAKSGAKAKKAVKRAPAKKVTAGRRRVKKPLVKRAAPKRRTKRSS